MDELERRLGTVAAAAGKATFSPRGPHSGGGFAFEAECRGHALTFRHANMEVRASNLELIGVEEWKESEDDGLYPILRGGCRNFYYRADVEFRVGKARGRGRIALGHWRHREGLLVPALGWGEDKETIDSLLRLLDRTLAALYHTELLGPAKPAERDYPEDRGLRGWKGDF